MEHAICDSFKDAIEKAIGVAIENADEDAIADAFDDTIDKALEYTNDVVSLLETLLKDKVLLLCHIVFCAVLFPIPLVSLLIHGYFFVYIMFHL